MSRPWTNETTGLPLFDQYVNEIPSYRKVIHDGFVTPEEYSGQEQKVAGLMQQFEAMLEPDERAVAMALLCEWAVLNAMKAVLPQVPHTEMIDSPE